METSQGRNDDFLLFFNLFFNALGFQVTNIVKDSPWKVWQYFTNLSAVTTTKLI